MMNGLNEKTEFDDWESFLAAKKAYEEACKTLLSTRGSRVLKGDNDIAQQFRYDNKIYHCKAGSERPTQSKGIRVSSTYKMGCPVVVSDRISEIYMKT